MLKKRLADGREAKARRGELIHLLPPGYVIDGRGQVVKDPHLRVREAIALANNEILTQSQASPEHAGMTCVLTLALLTDRGLSPTGAAIALSVMGGTSLA